jgi:hypothetical protein
MAELPVAMMIDEVSLKECLDLVCLARGITADQMLCWSVPGPG